MRRAVNGPGSLIISFDVMADRLMSNSTSSFRFGGRRASNLSISASLVTVASTVDLNTRVGGKLSADPDSARSLTRRATARVML